ncbi:hypothetical protein BC351_05505 [Paenibacillus ferrarius]|uniref:Uncharacterized protein n=1 Tax=Paenibacillus ferrarius TaxID=1469647 RepID=A0A1V4HFZ0_9BACL|nr:hypothetical protein [Paenibacillus ferrarius]OPH53332.1 hypothetical protein BC351_05505 [Paenibacillus ferrarius]
MKKKAAILLTAVLCLSFTSSAFAAVNKDTEKTTNLKGFDLKAELIIGNFLNPNGYARNTASLQSYQLKATVKVTNSDGTTDSKTSTGTNTTQIETGTQYANTYSSTNVKFDGGHEFTDSKYGYWYASTYYYF